MLICFPIKGLHILSSKVCSSSCPLSGAKKFSFSYSLDILISPTPFLLVLDHIFSYLQVKDKQVFHHETRQHVSHTRLYHLLEQSHHNNNIRINKICLKIHYYQNHGQHCFFYLLCLSFHFHYLLVAVINYRIMFYSIII